MTIPHSIRYDIFNFIVSLLIMYVMTAWLSRSLNTIIYNAMALLAINSLRFQTALTAACLLLLPLCEAARALKHFVLSCLR